MGGNVAAVKKTRTLLRRYGGGGLKREKASPVMITDDHVFRAERLLCEAVPRTLFRIMRTRIVAGTM